MNQNQIEENSEIKKLNEKLVEDKSVKLMSELM